MKKAILVIALLALVSLMIAPVMAETLTGTLGGTNITQTSQTFPADDTVCDLKEIYVNGLEYAGSTVVLVHFDAAGHTITVDVNASVGVSIPFTGRLTSISGEQIVSGVIGYQRYFDALGVEQPGYQYLQFNDDWNLTGPGKTGAIYLFLNYSVNDFYNGTYSAGSTSSTGMGNGDMYFTYGQNAYSCYGTGLRTISETASATYTFTKPLGLKISGSIVKTTGLSRAFVFNGTSPFAGIASELTMSTNPITVNTISDTIIASILSPTGIWYNSSVLFAPTVPTPTPTPAPTIAPGYVRNNLYVWDQNDAQIVGADVDVLDVEAGTWTNTTADADGWITIDTLPYHTVNVYAHYPTSNIYLPNEILGLETGYYGGHNWVIVLYPYTTTPSGFVTLYINTRDYNSKAVLVYVNLQIKNLVTGAITGESTGSTDNVQTVVVNATNYQITGSKSGYLSKTININSGEASSKTVVVELSKATVTPTITSTIPPGGVTTVVTVDPAGAPGDAGYSNAKGQEIMDYLASHGMELVSICFVVTILGLLKMVSKK